MSGEWPLVGRTDELAAVRRVLAEPDRAGALLAGAAGVGKTRLAREALAVLAAAGAHVERAVGTAGTRELPFGALLHLLPEALPTAHRATALLHAAEHRLLERAGGAPLLLAVDDVNHLDELSATLVRHVAEAGLAQLLLTMRSGSPVPDTLAGLYADGRLTRIEVGALSREHVSALLEQVLGGQVGQDSVARLWASSAGNLLYLHELVLDALDAGTLAADHGVWRWDSGIGPGTRITEILGARLSGLPDEERKLLDLLAVGEPLPLPLTRRLTSYETTAALERRRLVEVSPEPRDHVRLAHPLYAEVLRGQLPTTEQRRLSALLADASEDDCTAPDRDLLRLVTWRVNSGTVRNAGRVAIGARLANQMNDPATAERLARAALDHGHSFEAALQLGAALNEQGRFAEADTALAPLVGHEPDEAARRAVAYHRMRVLFYGLGNLDAACAALCESERGARTEQVRDVLRGWRAAMLSHAGRYAEAAELAAGLTETADPRARLAALATLAGGRLMTGAVQQAVRTVESCVALTIESGSQVGPLLAALHVLALQADGALDATAVPLAQLPVADPDRPLTGGDEAVALALRGGLELQRGRPRSALRLLREAAVYLREHDAGGFLAWCLSLQVEAAALLADASTATLAAQEAACHAGRGVRMFDGDAARARCWAPAAAGNATATVAGLDALGQQLADSGAVSFATHALHDAVRLGAGAVTRHRLLDVAAANDSQIATWCTAQARGLCDGDPVALRSASAGFEACDNMLLAAEAAAQAGEAAGAAGLRVRASADLRRARNLAARCEGARTPVLAASAHGGRLTPREHEAATLAARGLTNQQIAENLVASVRTVEGHLQRSYAKLGITTRADLADALAAKPS